jgi:hypothetical protein
MLHESLMIAVCKVNVEVQKNSGSGSDTKKVGKQTTYSTLNIPQCIRLMRSFMMIVVELNFPQTN